MSFDALNAFVQLTPVGLFQTDARGHVTFVNDRWSEIAGLSPAMAVGEGWVAALHPDDRDRVVDAWAQALRAQQSSRCEYRFLRPDGRVTWVLGHAVAQHDADGALLGYVGAVTDISDRKRAETALRKAQRDHAALINSVEGIVWEADPASLDFLFVSEQAERLLGYPLSEWFDTPNAWVRYLHPDDRDRVIDHCLAETKAGRPHDFEYRMIAADGRIIWLRDIVNLRWEGGRVARLDGIMTDITERKRAEEALRLSEQHFRALIENSWDSIVLFSADARILYATDATKRILGYATDEIVGRSAFDFVHHDAREAVELCLQESLRRPGEGIRCEAAVRHKDGTWRFLEGVFTNLLHDPSVGAIVNNYRDATERKLANQILERSERQFRALVENSWDGVALLSPDARMLYASPAAARMLGYAPDDLTGRTALEFIMPEDRAAVAEALQRSLKQPSEVVRCEARVMRKDGTWRHVEGMMRNLLHEPAIRAIVDNFRDVTERRSAELTREASEQRFRDFAEVASDWFWETGPDHRLTFLSDRITAFGADRQKWIGHYPWEFAADARQGRTSKWEELRAQLDRREPFRDFVYKILAADGSTLFMAASGKPFYDQEGRFCGYRGVGRDVTTSLLAEQALREAKESAEEASVAKSRFLATMSHELRTPLNAVIGFADLMRTAVFGPLGNDRYRAYAEDIHASAQHLLQIINDILDVARIEAGRFRLQREDLNPADILGDAVRIMATEFDRAGVRVAVDVAADAPLFHADRRAIRQVILNLLSNAVKFTPTGGRISVGARHERGTGTRLWVSDTGMGIPPEHIANLGQPFVQLDSAYARKGQGMGLGLALVRSLVGMHGGRVAIDSELGRGTTVSIVLPDMAA